MNELVAFAALAVMLLFSATRSDTRVIVALATCLTFLAVFQTTGGRMASSLSASYVVPIALTVLAVLLWRRGALPAAFIPLALYMAFAAAFVWDGGDGQLNASFNIFLAATAWCAGLFLGGYVRASTRVEKSLALLLAAVVLTELVVTVLQISGVPIFASTGRTLELEGGRANGTFQHPADVGKVITLCLVLLLPLLRSTTPSTRRIAGFAIVASLIPVAASESRANFISALAMILVWSVIRPHEPGELGKRVLLPAGVGVVALFFLNTILERFQEDPLGGERQHFTEVALEQISRTPWFGVGPGAYLRVVGQYDALTAQGWPVHNIFLLQAVELGLIGAALFYLPLILLMVRAVRMLPVKGRAGDFARGALSYLPALAIIGGTGWGLLSPGMAGFMFFVLGLSLAQFRGPELEGEAGLRQAAGLATLSTTTRTPAK